MCSIDNISSLVGPYKDTHPEIFERSERVHEWSLVPPKGVEIDRPWLVVVAAVGILAASVLFHIVTLGIPFIFRAYSEYKIYNLKSAIQEKFADTLETALTVELQGRSFSKNISEWLQSRTFSEDCQSAYFKAERRKLGSGQKVQNRVVRESEQFCRMVQDIYKMVKDRKNYVDIRKKMHEAMKTPVYQSLKTKQLPAVEFLQVLAVKLSSADCREAIREYGKQCITPVFGDSPDGDLGNGDLFTWRRLAEILDDEVDGYSYKRNTLFQSCIAWGFHPFGAIRSVGSMFTPMNYNPHATNPSLYAHDFSLDDKSIRFCYGPGPTGDLIYNDGVLVYMDKLQGKGVNTTEFRINLQSHRSDHKLHKTTPEHLRVCEMLRYEEKHPSSLQIMSLAFDTRAREMGEDFVNPESDHFELDDVFHEVAQHYLNPDQLYDPGYLKDKNPIRCPDESAFQQIRHDGKDNGWFIPERILKATQVVQAFVSSKALFDELDPPQIISKAENAKEHLKQKKAFGRVMILTIEGMVSLAALHKVLINAPSKGETEREALDRRLDEDLVASRAFGHCKQDIDRAIVNNIVLRLFHRTYTDTSPLTRNEIYEIIGGVLGRARIVDGRTILKKRYNNLSDLLCYFGDETRVKNLQKHLRSYIKECCIVEDF